VHSSVCSWHPTESLGVRGFDGNYFEQLVPLGCFVGLLCRADSDLCEGGHSRH